MNVLLLGSGGRECTLAWKLRKSPLLTQLYIAPGNAGTSDYGINIFMHETDFESIAKFCIKEDIEILVVGPEQPLADGIYDYFTSRPELGHICVIGPSQEGAKLESSKEFAKEFMKKYGIPTAAYQSFGKNDFDKACDFLKTMQPPYVLKADGLAAGKGVIIPDTIEEAEAALKEMLVNDAFGKAGNRVVIEEFLDGVELSVFVLTDGRNYLLLPEAKDYKRIGEGNTGLNTGGMGSISPVPFANQEFMNKVIQQIIEPTLFGIQKEKIKYTGFIFFGLIKVGEDPFVIEYNVRMGDPETESVIPRIENDLLDLLRAVKEQKLGNETILISSQAATTVMMVSGGYPEDYEKGFQIEGLNSTDSCHVFHAGTSKNNHNQNVTSGGRVVAITAMAETPKEALKKCYDKAETVKFEKSYYRKDIGFDIL